MANQRSNTQTFKHSVIKLSTFALLLVLLSCNASISVAQSTSSDKKAQKLYSEAQAFYQAYNLNEAELTLHKALERDPNFVEAQTLLAYIYIDNRQEEKAKACFEKAIAINPRAIPNNFFFLGELELNQGNYEEAKTNLSQFIAIEEIDPKLLDRANQQLDNIDFAIQAKKNPYPFEPINLGPNINSEFLEYFPSMTVDEKTILFTRRLPDPKSPTKYNEDFYLATKVNGEWQKAQNMGAPINTEINEGAPSLAANGQLMIYAACEIFGNYGGGKLGAGSCDLFYSVKNDQVWTKPINLGGLINTNNWETQPSFSADGKSLYFVKGKRGMQSMSDGNIYVTKLQPEGSWSKPTPLNANINTKGNEESVLIHPDGKTLYFSSDGHVGMGGLDIFMSQLDENGEWGPAVNLGYPINTHKNENSLLVSPNGKIAIFASDREGGYGGLDLYQFDLPQNFAPNKVTYFAGKIYDSKTKKPLGARFELLDLETGEAVIEAYSDNATGEFLVTLPTGKNYALNSSKSGYMFFSENFSLMDRESDEPFIQNVPLNPILAGEKIILKNIFFETAKYDLKKESKVELDKLAAFLTKNENLIIEIGGHTDNVGNAQLNLSLSKNRANSVKDYLTKNGIDAERLQTKGYGAGEPIADNSTAEGKAKNRRTEFKIIKL
ncbi:MAG: outer membrane protein OmpA-like peptidoglycan-associated protein [Vicingaceae bacterium]|jgi:outer membrane protein OmpA-like peptidoglycan-associated protein